MPDPTHNKVLLEWRTPEFIPHPKGARWFLVFSVIMLTLTVYAILTGSATMAIVFLLLGGMVYLTHNQEPKMIAVSISELGVTVEGRFYPYGALGGFWIVYNPPFVTRLYLQVAGKVNRVLKIELNQQSPIDVRRLLAKELSEIEGGDEPMTDLFTRLFRLQ